MSNAILPVQQWKYSILFENYCDVMQKFEHSSKRERVDIRFFRYDVLSGF